MTLLQLLPLFAVAVISLAILLKKLLAPSRSVQAKATFDLPAWKREQLNDRMHRLREMRDCVAEIRANAMVEVSNLKRLRAHLASLEEEQVKLAQRNGITAEIRLALTREISTLKLDVEKRVPIAAAAELLNTLATAELRRTTAGVEKFSKELDEQAAHLRQQALALRFAALA
ncbi:hypothetical protein KBI23_15945 [bacterium]|nr:hypothetical protein [bacterium]MBP9810891.1 hypothetical protein [bacterium]